ncbi:MAG: hypothetical protein AB7E67_00700 [Xanthobacteraceae bacterium]
MGSRRRSRSGLPPGAVLFGGFVFAGGLLSALAVADRHSATNDDVARLEAPHAGSTADGTKTYHGSMVIHETPNRCRHYGFDNRSGKMWATGSIDCEEANVEFVSGQKSDVWPLDRIQAIQKSFRGQKI